MSLFVNKYNFTRAALRTFSTKIGFIGVGNMGSRMAQNLLKKEETLVIYDTSEQNLKSFKNQKNVTIANSVKEVAQNSECIITMLPDDSSVWSVFTEHDGILKNTQKENILLIDCSTINPELSQKISGLCKEKQNSFLDAPVSGGVVGAENGTLTFMVGGCELTTKVVEPLLFKMGSKIIYCGSSGMGQAAKLCNNMLLAISMAGVAESMNCGIKFGLDAKLLASVINSSTGRCWSSDVYNPVPGVIENVPSSRDYQGGFKTRFLVKDIKLALNLAKSTDSSIPLALKAQEMYADAVKKGYGDLDFSVIYKYLSENKES